MSVRRPLVSTYRPQDLQEVLSVIEGNLDSSLDPMQRATKVVMALHKAGWKIVNIKDPH